MDLREVESEEVDWIHLS